MEKSVKQRSIPFFSPLIGEEEIEEVVDTLRSGWLTTGPKVHQFEEDFAQYVGANHAIAVSSCTAALHLALEALGIGEGDEVLVPTLTFASTANVVIHLGARPVLLDCDSNTLTLDVSQIEDKITPRTKAIIPVHYGGQPCQMDEILRIARRNDLFVVEDAAHGIPARYRDWIVGTIGDITCFSFYANKTITTGEGGMITTDREDLAERMRMMSLHGITKDAWKRYSNTGSWYYEILAPGFKYNMTNINAALGIHQLKRSDEFWEIRQSISDRYHQAFSGLEELHLPSVRPEVRHAWHLFVIRLNLETLTIDRAAFMKRLGEQGVGTSVHYMPLHMHPLYRDSLSHQPNDFPNAASAFEEMISIPIFPKMSDQDVNYVIDAVKQTIREHAIR